MNQSLQIGELAKRTGCLVETIRYYEREGLLPTLFRSKGNYRLFSDIHVERLRFIRHCRSLDMTLKEIRTLLRFRDTPDENCSEVTLYLMNTSGTFLRESGS
jgi:DNA-binding transcriptional MerR regulator